MTVRNARIGDRPQTPHAARRAKAAARGAADPSLIPHGTVSGYVYWSCRCPDCTGAHTASVLKSRAGKRRQVAA